MTYIVHGFVDGGYLRAEARNANCPMVNPRTLVGAVAGRPEVQDWASSPASKWNAATGRVTYYDGRPDDGATASTGLLAYWNAVELLDDTELGFGSLRGGARGSPPRQKGVDTLLAVHMLVGAFTGIYNIAVLVAGDADFVPVVKEVRRRGIMVVVAAVANSMSEELRRAADRYVPIGPNSQPPLFPALRSGDKTFAAE